jgi:hypothetical protein
VVDGSVIGQCMARHRHQEFIRFLNRIEAAVPAGKLIHAILDNYASHLYAVRTDTPAIAAQRPPDRPAGCPRCAPDTGGKCAVLDPPATVANPRHKKESTMNRHARILVNVHPRLWGKLFRSRNHSFNPSPRMSNLHSSHN